MILWIITGSQTPPWTLEFRHPFTATLSTRKPSFVQIGAFSNFVGHLGFKMAAIESKYVRHVARYNILYLYSNFHRNPLTLRFLMIYLHFQNGRHFKMAAVFKFKFWWLTSDRNTVIFLKTKFRAIPSILNFWRPSWIQNGRHKKSTCVSYGAV